MTDTPSSSSELLLPALQARMGDWVYYISSMRMTDIAQRVSIAEHIHASASLRDLLQRQLTDNANRISEYLQRQQQRFFNALVIGTYGGAPKWREVSIRDGVVELPEDLEGVLGFLDLSGTETLFAIDGQHRVAGIKAAIEEDPDLGEEEVATIFVRGVSATDRTEDPKGFERTRRLFSTLNRYAKPVQKRDIIALDEDDVVAICTRRLIEDHPLFAEKTGMYAQKPLPARDRDHFTSIVALYACLNIYLKLKFQDSQASGSWRNFLAHRPEDQTVDDYLEASVNFWNLICEQFQPVREVRDSDDASLVVAKYRRQDGGHLLFRPVGLETVVESIRRLLKLNWSLTAASSAVAQVPMELAEAPWSGLLWDPQNQRMLTAPERKKVAWRIVCWGVGADITKFGFTKAELRNELAGLLGQEPQEIELKRYN